MKRRNRVILNSALAAGLVTGQSNAPAQQITNPAPSADVAETPASDNGSTQASANSAGKGGLARVIDDTSAALTKIDDTTRLRPEVDLYGADIALRLKSDNNNNHYSDGSLDMVGLTPKHEGISAGWRGDIIARQTDGYGALEPSKPSQQYGGRTQAIVTAKKGHFSAEGEATAFAGDERFQVHPPNDIRQIEGALPVGNRPLVSGTVSAYGQMELPHALSVGTKDDKVRLGAVAIGAGGDKYWATTRRGEDAEACVTGATLGDGAAAVSLCRQRSGKYGYDDPNGAGDGWKGQLTLDPSRMDKVTRGLKEIGSATEKVLHRRNNNNTGQAKN